MVLETVKQLRKKLLTDDKVLEYDQKEIFPEEAIREMLGPEIGLQMLFIPEDCGGMGGGARDCCAVTREMAKICLGISTAFFAIQLGADPLLVGATQAQREKWLGAIAEKGALVAYAVTEPEAGSNLAALKTKADPVLDGEGNVTGYNINGNKQFISNGGYADFITLLANTPEGPAFFVVEKGTPGFNQGKGEEKHGIRASNTSPLSFEDVFVPIDHLIGQIPGQGLKQANKVFGYTRLMVASMAVGAAEAALDIVVPYAKERVQFGSPLSDKQGYTHKLVIPNVVRLEAAIAYMDEIALRLDSEETDLQVEGSIAKLFATEVANKTAEDAIQALGGYGYITEYRVEKIKRDVKITCIYEGTSEIQQNIISTFRWKKTRKSKGEFYRSMAMEMEQLDSELESAGCRFFGWAALALNATIDKVHESRMTKRQFVMFLLADMMTSVEVGASLAKKAVAMHRANDPKKDRIRAACRIFADETARLVSQNISQILRGTGFFDDEAFSAFARTIPYQELNNSVDHTIEEMDTLADILFER
jgi:alkylation response protein AidB-like acyl-CoA dehydrogenase